MAEHNNILKVHIELIDSDPPIWRQVQVPGRLSLEGLHLIIQAAMGWQNAYAYFFKLSASPNARIADLAAANTPELIYSYDPQDGWLHRLRFEGASKVHGSIIACLAGEGACPPERSGGIWGYEELLERLNDPEDPEYVELWDWVGGNFNPDRFCLSDANQRLACLGLEV